ncbi:MAG: hypothetical protein IJT02_06960 [Synergistaceae bacterium]|nr:hypothetical protein [Synergistaceae bacterium]
MSRTNDFLEQCGFYYLLTVDGDYPSGRPISRILEKDGAMYFGTRTEKEFYRQLKQNPMGVERFGTSANPLLAVFRMDVVRAELHSTGDKVEDITERV